MSRDYPYTSDDLRGIADYMDEVAADIKGGFDMSVIESSWKWLLKVDVVEPDGDEIIGQLRPYGDGWIGFYPRALTKEDNHD